MGRAIVSYEVVANTIGVGKEGDRFSVGKGDRGEGRLHEQ
jgi:RIO-like serine/threonine protein kinase